jgi:putative ABC transport system substrate-binding protein
MRRRDFIIVIGGAAAWPLTGRAQQPTIPVVAFVHGGSSDTSARNVAAFRKGLSETGYVEGQNVAVDYHWLEGQFDRLPRLRPKLRPRRSQSSLASAKTRPNWVWSPAWPARAAMRPASTFSSKRF